MGNEAINVLKSRRAVREYLSKPIPKDIIEDILDCGRLAPSARNLQPWLFVATANEKIKQGIAQLATHGSFISDAAVCISVFCERDNSHSIEDGSAATTNILNAAKAHGIDSCWVAGYDRVYSEEVRELLGVPEKYMLISLIPLGYTDKKVSKPKKPLTEIVRWEKY